MEISEFHTFYEECRNTLWHFSEFFSHLALSQTFFLISRYLTRNQSRRAVPNIPPTCVITDCNVKLHITEMNKGLGLRKRS